MIVALLFLIVFILLFGAGVVKGWLKNVAALALGFAVLVGLTLWVGSFFGPKGPTYVLFGILSLLLVLAIWVKATEPIAGSPSGRKLEREPQLPGVRPLKLKPPQQFHSRVPSREDRKRLREQHRDGPRGG